MKARTAAVYCMYDGKDISADLAGFLKSFSVREVLSGEADSAEITLEDREELWQGGWMPDRGAIMTVTIGVGDWEASGDNRTLPLGKFEVDEITNTGPPNEAKIKLISIPNSSNLRSVEKTRAWEKVKLSQIIKDVADGAGMESYYDADDDPIQERAEQSEQTDLSFLQKLCKDAGLALKVTDEKIVVFDIAKYEQADPVMEIWKNQVLSFDCRTTIHDIYKACHVKYKHSQKDELIEYTFTDPNRKDGQTLQVNEKVDSLEAAEKLAKKKLHEKNLEEVSVSLTMMGNFALLASNTVQLHGWHNYDGKYLITRSTHDVGNGYTTKIELRRVIDGY
ncbi:phage late control D family protein [uncultured Mitsuokella sp.]|uniref:phage late control D family protein n=1 Tax=uncultured Mitsuokella sp. TaxID=453120 RepID=UPI00258A57F0|nr:contractile injection system protein, VgrG/Pvc8 family [uncultured Mitsuokella sp.]